MVTCKRKAILHLGSEKTGSSSLQAWLRANAHALLRQNILYPAWPPPGPHVELTTTFRKFRNGDPLYGLLGIRTSEEAESFRTSYQREFLSQLGCSHEHDTLIISDEHIFGYLTEVEEIRALFDFFRNQEYDIKPVLILRNPESYILAMLSEAVKCLSIGGFDPSNPILSTSSLDPRLRYDFIIENIWLALGQRDLAIVAYEEHADFSTIQAFLTAADIDTYSLASTHRPTGRHNQSIPYPLLPFYAAVASYIINNNITSLAREWRKIVDQAIETYPFPSKSGLDLANKRMMEHWFNEPAENLRNMTGDKLSFLQNYSTPSEQKTALSDISWQSFCESIVIATPLELRHEMIQACEYFRGSQEIRMLAYRKDILECWDANIAANMKIIRSL